VISVSNDAGAADAASGNGADCASHGGQLVGGSCVFTTEYVDAGVAVLDASTLRDGGASLIDTGVGGATDVDTACLGSEDKFVLTGAAGDYISGGKLTVIQGGAGWRIGASAWSGGLPETVSIGVGNNWSANFSTLTLGTPLAPGKYENAQRWPFADPGHPQLSIYGDGAGCNMLSGTFRILSIEATPSSDDAGMPPTLTSFTATFEQYCDNSMAAAVGCVHVSQPAP
jgi:hypothetical protein